jgi:protein-S-isoprenylcysteine O-methyltransferase Ste14
MKGKILVTIQFSCIFLLAIFTKWQALPWWTLVLLGLSGLLAFGAMGVMKYGNFNVVPTPVEKGRLVTNGPYSVIRHPMYTSIFIFAIALLAAQFNIAKLLVCIALILGLIVKMLYEESLLRKHFEGYESYIHKTKRVIPFIW